MSEIIMKMLLCLLIAFILGFIIGWLLRGLFCKDRIGELEGELKDRDDKLRGLKSSGAAVTATAATAVKASAPAVDTSFDSDYDKIKARLDELENLATDDEEDSDEELQGWTTETEALRGKIAALKGRASTSDASDRVDSLDGTAVSLLGILKKAREDKAAGIAKLRRVGYGDGVRDDLKDIVGVGPALEKILNTNNVYLFKDIATWDDAGIAGAEDYLGSFQGPRVRREDWVGQCKELHFKKYGERV
jgi:predicted flap endonuclease-1-like 5' DNA nuclease